MKTIISTDFGVTKNNEKTTLFTMTNNSQMNVSITDFGGAVTAVKVPDRDGRLIDVVLGYEKLADYETAPGYFGTLVGRHANRIANGAFSLNGRQYQLAKNDGRNHLHGGNIGFSHRMWEAEPNGQSLKLTLFSPDMEEGYPGNLKVSVTYSLDDENRLSIIYKAESDQDTVCNLTNHSYFNLNGHNSGSVENHLMKIHASYYLPTDSGSIPTGVCQPVAETPFDFREYKTIGCDIGARCDQLLMAGGYDHNYVLDKGEGLMQPAAEVFSPKTGIKLSCDTTQPGMQFYTGNSISAGQGKEGALYQARGGFCLETQAFPDAVNHDNFPSALLRAGECYNEATIYQFQTLKENL